MIPAVALGLVGVFIGSFLNVVIWRVPKGESVVRPRSKCPQCDHEIRGRDNIPVLSWLVLRGHCRDCGAGISVRYPLIEVFTGILFGLIGAKFGWHAPLPGYLYLSAVGLALAAIDIDCHRLPDVLTLPSYPIGAALLTIAALVDHRPGTLVRTAAGAAILFAVYALLWVIYPGGMGRGDVKLAGVLGMYLAFLGWGTLAVGAFLGFLYGGVLGIALMAAGRAGRKSKIPFGPFMLAGALTAVFVGQHVAHGYISVTSG